VLLCLNPTYFHDLSIMTSPRIDKPPLPVGLLVPDLKVMIGGCSNNTIAVKIVAYGLYNILMTMSEPTRVVHCR